MFYAPYKFRRQTEYCSPKGPNINWAPWRRFSINGTEIKLKVPRHKSRSPMETQSPRVHYELNKDQFEDYRNNKNRWQALGIIARGWDFNGPWFIGTRASMDMHAVIITPKVNNSSLSFFHPRAFESGITDFMAYLYSDKISSVDKSQHMWLTPMNWQPLLNHPCIAVQFDALANKAVKHDGMNRFLFFPLTDQHILMIKFPITRHNFYIYPNTEAELHTDKWINNAPMEQLATDIIHSLKITLSPEAKQQQEKALAGLPDSSLIREFPPIKWAVTPDETQS